MAGTARKYHLRCCGCGAVYEDDGVRLDCSRAHSPSLVRSVYPREFAPDGVASMARYRKWLPLGRELATTARVAVYGDTALGRRLGLPNLWIAFSGWWPERGATLATTTFKELEAYTVLARLAPEEKRTLVVASAGNTAAAFAHAATESDLPVLIVVPLDAWERLASLVRIGPTVRVVAIADGLYEDAIALSRTLGDHPAFVLEGGVRNVARRDGMGTVMLAAAEAIGALPSAYFQGVGSGAGALAVHEAALRLAGDGRYGTTLPRLVLAQNAPFAPIHDAWECRSLALDECAPALARERVRQIAASVLSNLAPPYGTAGGLREALTESGGHTYAIANAEVASAIELFAELEGIDVEPAAGVAIAALIRAAREGRVRPDEIPLLHVTGGGAARRERVAAGQRPALVVERGDSQERMHELVGALFA